MAGAIVNPRVLSIARPNARLRARQRIIRARMGNITPPPTVALPAPAEQEESEPEDVPTATAPHLSPLTILLSNLSHPTHLSHPAHPIAPVAPDAQPG